MRSAAAVSSPRPRASSVPGVNDSARHRPSGRGLGRQRRVRCPGRSWHGVLAGPRSSATGRRCPRCRPVRGGTDRKADDVGAAFALDAHDGGTVVDEQRVPIGPAITQVKSSTAGLEGPTDRLRTGSPRPGPRPAHHLVVYRSRVRPAAGAALSRSGAASAAATGPAHAPCGADSRSPTGELVPVARTARRWFVGRAGRPPSPREAMSSRRSRAAAEQLAASSWSPWRGDRQSPPCEQRADSWQCRNNSKKPRRSRVARSPPSNDPPSRTHCINAA